MKMELYVKNKNGRYERYREPVEEDDRLYIKKGKKYYPWGMELKGSYLQEGVWVVTRNKYSWGVANGKYLKEAFELHKCSNLEKLGLNLAQLGTLKELCDEAFEMNCEGKSAYDAFYARVSYILNKLEDGKC